MSSPLQYGNGLKAYIRLLVCQMISLNRTQKLIKSMIGEILAEATLLKFVLRLYLALESWELKATEKLKNFMRRLTAVYQAIFKQWLTRDTTH